MKSLANVAIDLRAAAVRLRAFRRTRLLLGHLLLSAGAVGIVVALVLLVWYPTPLYSLQGVLSILAIVVLVDLIIGPLITFVISADTKPRRELIRDLTIIGFVQLAALTYGTYSVFVARPAFVVFNADRFDAISANEVMRDAPFPYRDTKFEFSPVLRPLWVMARQPESLDEQKRIMFSAALYGGPDIKDYPALYEDWPQKQSINASRLKPLRDLETVSKDGKKAVEAALRISGLKENELAYVPLKGREKIGVVILNRETHAIVLASDATPNY